MEQYGSGSGITGDISLVVADVPEVYVSRLLRFIALAADDSPHLEFNLMWIERMLRQHGRYIREHRGVMREELMLVQRAIKRIQDDLGRLADENGFMLDYLLNKPVVGKDVKMLDGADAAAMDDDALVEEMMKEIEASRTDDIDEMDQGFIGLDE